jgi:PBSX family phage terminase large subunit
VGAQVNLVSLSAKQRESWRLATARQNVWEGSVRSGKTVGSLLAWSEYARSGPAGNLLMTGKTERTLRRNVIDPLAEIWGSQRVKLNQGQGELNLYGRKIWLVGANDERAQEKIRGLTLAGAYVDEATTVPESFWAMLLSRLSEPGAQLFATTNPDSPAHWLKRDYLDRAEVHLTRDGKLRTGDPDQMLSLARFSFRLRDNDTLPAAYVTAIEREYAGLWYRRYIDGEWVAAEGAIYDLLDVQPGGAHVVTEVPGDLADPVLAIDYGTANPTHALLAGISADNQLYIVREWRWDSRARHRQLTDLEQVDTIWEWLANGCDGYFVDEQGRGVPVPIQPRQIVVDPSAASFRLAWNRKLGGWPTPADNTVLDGIRDVASLLACERLKIDASCTQLIDELVGYSWDTRAQMTGDDAPMKADDHGPDALRYLVRHLRNRWRHWLAAERMAA